MDLLLLHKYITVCGIVHERNIPEAGQERFWMLSLILSPPPQFLTFKGGGPIHVSTYPATSPRFLRCLVSAALEHLFPLF